VADRFRRDIEGLRAISILAVDAVAFDQPTSCSHFWKRYDYADPTTPIAAVGASFMALVGIIHRSA
jgi:hypothetical protein